MPLTVVPDPRTTHSLADRRAQFNLSRKLADMLGEMSVAVDRLNLVRLALDSRAQSLPAGDPLVARLRSASGSVDALRKKIVATKEGGAITGEERLRENLADLYSSVIGYDGRPTQMEIDRTDAIGRVRAARSHSKEADTRGEADHSPEPLRRPARDPHAGEGSARRVAEVCRP